MSGRKRDIGKSDVEALARALRLPLPKGWSISTGWTLCLERAHVLADSYRQPTLPLERQPRALLPDEHGPVERFSAADR